METDETRLDLASTIRELYEIVAKLEKAYPGRHFTPDGHLVGSLGEVYVAERYGIHLYEAAHPTHDGYWPDSDDEVDRGDHRLRPVSADYVHHGGTSLGRYIAQPL